MKDPVLRLDSGLWVRGGRELSYGRSVPWRSCTHPAVEKRFFLWFDGAVMATREKTLESRGYPLSQAPAPAGIYTPVVVHGGIAYLSGAVPATPAGMTAKGSVPSVVSVSEAQQAAELCAANLLRVFARDVGPLERIERIIKLTGFVNADPGFAEPHIVVNGASQLFIDVLGEAGHHARSAVGMATLPGGASVEIELIAAVRA